MSNKPFNRMFEALQRLVWAIEFNDKDATRERMSAAREALSPAELGGVEAVAWRFLDEDGKPTSKWADMDAKPMHYRDGMLTPGAYPGTSIQYAYTTPRAAEAVPEELASLLCNAFDNLNDLPINDDWACRWCRQFEKTDFGKRLLASALTPPSAKGE